MLWYGKPNIFNFFFNLVLNVPQKDWPYLYEMKAKPTMAGIHHGHFKAAISLSSAPRTPSYQHCISEVSVELSVGRHQTSHLDAILWSTGKLRWLTLPSCWTDVDNEPTLNSSITSTLSATFFNQTTSSGGRELVWQRFRWQEESSHPFSCPALN